MPVRRTRRAPAAGALPLLVEELPTPIGGFLLVTDEGGALRAADWADCRTRLTQLLDRHCGEGGYALRDGSAAETVTRAIRRYFAGDLAAIDAVPVATAGTAFQQAVWAALREIPAGSRLGYAVLAERLGRPAAARAVGHANGANPVSVVVPCHRLVGASGALTGYAGGLERKRWLLTHEGAARPFGRDTAG